jgi:hypothetical protein
MAASTAAINIEVDVRKENTFSSHLRGCVRGCGKRNWARNSPSGAVPSKNDGLCLLDIVCEQLMPPL